ncbi:hypothetical protein D6S36_17335 [Salmonella enterica subsp. enterica]|nr:hypothetical protein [Salmonella enterica subsp. enterica serovar Corvallis]
MTTFTDKELIKEIKERIGSLDVRDNIERRAYEIALASLEADPVAYIFKHPAGKLFWALTDESNKEQADVIPVYAAPPVPVVPAALPENDDDDGHDIDYLEPSEVYSLGRTAGWNACRAAMLHGAEPVSQTYKLPPLSSNEVNDAAWKLHNMLTEHGPLNGRQFNNLKGCFYEALKVAMRNYPVTPDGWISRFEEMPDPSSEKRVCAFTPTNHEDMRYRFVPASLFKTVCRDATHWFYMLPPVGREEVAGG